jgi:7-cyano-7-deazaguanine tRNA-ribosyltransferase
MFEITGRDGLARMGVLTTRSGKIETPALLPVVNPKIFTVTPRELYEEFGFRALITNSYIIRNNEDLKERALSEGLHKMLDYDGIIMTDSGTFQSYMYGEVEVTNEEIIEFQKAIGTDIGTVLDIFTEPSWSEERTREAVDETLKRTAEAVSMKGDMMINGVVQGSVYNDLRTECARAMASMDVDVHPVGGVVPLMEQYRFSELVDVVISSKKGLNPNRPVHLFGAGHPMVLALSVLMGCDLFDSASYAKFARDDRLMFIDGTHRLGDMKYLNCDCPACRGHTLESLKAMNKKEREKTIARHNLYQIRNEMNTVKRYLSEGRLWELAENRCRSHPALLEGLRRLYDHSEFLERTEPVSRDGAMFYSGVETRGRPSFLRYSKRIVSRYVPPTKKAALFLESGKPYSRCYAEEFGACRDAGFTPVVISPFGPVPAELDEIYPLAQSVFPMQREYDIGEEEDELLSCFMDNAGFEEIALWPVDTDVTGEGYDVDVERARAVARYQFGIAAADALIRGDIELVTSRKTGKIRNVISDGEHVLSMRAGDGLFTLREEGARRILSAVPAPHMRVVVNDDSVPFVSQGRNAFCRFVLSADPEIRPMEEVIVTDSEDSFVATGRALLTADEISSMSKGVAVKVRSGTGD